MESKLYKVVKGDHVEYADDWFATTTLFRKIFKIEMPEKHYTYIYVYKSQFAGSWEQIYISETES